MSGPGPGVSAGRRPRQVFAQPDAGALRGRGNVEAVHQAACAENALAHPGGGFIAAVEDAVELADAGSGVIDVHRHEVVLDGDKVELTPTEWGILTTLARRPGRVYSRGELVNQVRGYEFAGYERTIDSHVKNLRHKLGPDGAAVVVTVLGVGYRLGLDRDR